MHNVSFLGLPLPLCLFLFVFLGTGFLSLLVLEWLSMHRTFRVLVPMVQSAALRAGEPALNTFDMCVATFLIGTLFVEASCLLDIRSLLSLE